MKAISAQSAGVMWTLSFMRSVVHSYRLSAGKANRSGNRALSAI